MTNDNNDDFEIGFDWQNIDPGVYREYSTAPAYEAVYACGNRIGLDNDQDPPGTCPECGSALADGEVVR